jgi:hypothetical protein
VLLDTDLPPRAGRSHIVTPMRILDDILRRVQSQQEKKRSMLRKLHVATAFHAGAPSA